MQVPVLSCLFDQDDPHPPVMLVRFAFMPPEEGMSRPSPSEWSSGRPQVDCWTEPGSLTDPAVHTQPSDGRALLTPRVQDHPEGRPGVMPNCVCCRPCGPMSWQPTRGGARTSTCCTRSCTPATSAARCAAARPDAFWFEWRHEGTTHLLQQMCVCVSAGSVGGRRRARAHLAVCFDTLQEERALAAFEAWCPTHVQPEMYTYNLAIAACCNTPGEVHLSRLPSGASPGPAIHPCLTSPFKVHGLHRAVSQSGMMSHSSWCPALCFCLWFAVVCGRPSG